MGNGPPEGGKCGSKWVRPKPVEDEEGYQLVQPARVRCKGGIPEGGNVSMGTTVTGDGEGAAGAPPPRPRWADDDSDDDAYMGDDAEDEDDGHSSDERAAHETDPRALKAKYDELSKAVRELEKQGRFVQGGTAIRALRAARDQAEQAWRDAKAPAPLPTRLARAEAKLGKARTSLDNARAALEVFDEQQEKQRATLLGKIQEAEAWFSWRQDQVDELHAEAGERAPFWRQPTDAAGSTEVRERIREQFLPELQTIMEHVEGNPEILERLSVLAAGLADAECRLDSGSGDRTQTFNMAGGDAATDDWGQMDNLQGEAMGSAGTEDPSRGGEGAARASAWKPEGPGRWSRTAAAMQASATNGGVSGAADRRATGAVDTLVGCDGKTGDGETVGSPAKARKCATDADTQAEARVASDQQRALELLQQQKAAESAQVDSYNQGKGGFGSQAALSLAAQKFVLEVQRAEARAAEKGIEPRHEDGRKLLELTPMELESWITANLVDEDAEY